MKVKSEILVLKKDGNFINLVLVYGKNNYMLNFKVDLMICWLFGFFYKLLLECEMFLYLIFVL